MIYLSGKLKLSLQKQWDLYKGIGRVTKTKERYFISLGIC